MVLSFHKSVEFEQAGCDQGCQRTFVLEAYETSTVDRNTARNTSNYKQIDRVAPFDDTGYNITESD